MRTLQCNDNRGLCVDNARDSRIVERVQCASVTMTEVEERASGFGNTGGMCVCVCVCV